ncbi:UDP-GalNAc:beta-1,3-N-acetylgalactosaminyltransferase 1 [Indicator indicator]|uniref:UDP-GalNAc:beta-1, 3-N-acetylgalactosaminyltransferase 1 n=1 Tax=Indicator indicator TaxID=1002788 RepID=UPI0023DEB575|nr:UDP-GalNAc:beta-1,3-N-acetylgalactosaminyltransferase 1 [Indicator indicator]
MHMRRLQWIFLFLLAFCVLTLWYVIFPSGAGSEQTNLLYFCDYEPLHRQRYLFTLWERSECKDIHPFLFLASRPQDVKLRQAIRIAWGSQHFWWGQRILTLFLLGEDADRVHSAAALSVEDESDIIRRDFMDTYDNLTLKTIMAFQWFTELGSNARFLMKTEDDVFINTPNLVKFLLRLNSSENVFTGYPFINNHAYRGYYRRRSISYQEYPFRLYPPCCSGMGYILDGRLPLRVYELMSHVKPIKFEDVYVGICLNILQVNVSAPEEKQFFLYKISFDTCGCRQLIAAHGITASEIISFWQALSSHPAVTCL